MAGGVLVLGSVNVDLTARLARLPRPGETVSGGVLHRGHGGKGANQAVAAARAGARVRFIGAVGEDADGDEVLAVLAEEGVDVSDVRRVVEHTGTALICVDVAGENQIAVAPGANARISGEGVEVAAAAVVVAQLEVPVDAVSELFRRARGAGARTILNAAPIRTGGEAAVLALLDLVDVLVVNQHELVALVGGDDAAPLMGAPPVRSVLVSRGADGLVWVAPGAAPLPVPGHEVDAIDTVGAGDALCGALAAALAQGRPDDEAIRRANAAGALATTRAGARSSPTAAEVDALLAASAPP